MSREPRDLDAAKVQMIEVEDEDENISRVDEVRKAFNSQMVELFQGSDLKVIIDEMFTHKRAQIKKNPALANSRFMFDQVLFLYINFHLLNLTRGSL